MAIDKNTIDELVETIKNNTPLVYEAGKTEGVEEGLDTVIDIQEEFLENQPKAYYDIFWDGLLDYGTRTNYNYFLNGKEMNWFKPKYDIKPTDANWFARDWGFNGGKEPIDLAEVLQECGVKMDFSNATNVTYLFYNAKISHLPEINVSKATAFNYLLFGNAVKTIDKFIAPTDKPMTQVFGYCSSLENIVFGSEIGGNLIMKDAKKLSKDSIKSAIDHLSDNTTGLTATFSKIAVNKAFETVEGLADGSTSAEWIALAGDENTTGAKPNWTISLI